MPVTISRGSRGSSSLSTMCCRVQGQAFLKSFKLISDLYSRDVPTDTLTNSCSRGKPGGKRSCSVMGHFLKSPIYKSEISPHTDAVIKVEVRYMLLLLPKPEINWLRLFSYSFSVANISFHTAASLMKKSIFSCQGPHIWQNGDILVVSSCLSLIHMNRYKWDHSTTTRKCECTFLFLWNLLQSDRNQQLMAAACRIRLLSGSRCRERASSPQCLLHKKPVKSSQLLRLSHRSRVKGQPSSWGL